MRVLYIILMQTNNSKCSILLIILVAASEEFLKKLIHWNSQITCINRCYHRIVSIMYRFLPEYWWRNRLQQMKGYETKTPLESIQHRLCSNYAKPSGGVTQICLQAAFVHLYCTVCDTIRDKLKLWVVSLIKLLSSCQEPQKSFSLQYIATFFCSIHKVPFCNSLQFCISSF